VRIVIDTNVIASGVFFGGPPRQVLQLWREKKFDLICSPDILDEYDDVLNRLVSKTGKADLNVVYRFMQILIQDCEVIIPRHTQKLSRDPDDDKFINCALSGKAFYVVSGDSDLLDIEEVEGIKIITAREFLEALKK